LYVMRKVQITIYRFTGKQWFFTIPKDWCVECDLLVDMVQDVVKELGIEEKVDLKIRPWFPWAWFVFLRYFVWHAPMLIVNGKLISQGIVPERQRVADALKWCKNISMAEHPESNHILEYNQITDEIYIGTNMCCQVDFADGTFLETAYCVIMPIFIKWFIPIITKKPPNKILPIRNIISIIVLYA